MQTVASHSPDHCWVLAGWKCTNWKSRTYPSGDMAGLGPVEARTFVSPNSQNVHVWYWHLENGKSTDYGFRGEVLRYTSRWLRDAFRQLFSSSPEQFFIRISSPQRLEDLAGGSGMTQLLAALASITDPKKVAARN